jgi:hypothetical protein
VSLRAGSGAGSQQNGKKSGKAASEMNTSLEQIHRFMTDMEGERLEFKEARKSYPFDKLLRYCAAIANEGGRIMKCLRDTGAFVTLFQGLIRQTLCRPQS